MSEDLCGICGSPMGSAAYYSAYTPYPTHADKSICVANIRADERERIAQAIEAQGMPDPQGDVGFENGWCACEIATARIARDGGRDE